MNERNVVHSATDREQWRRDNFQQLSSKEIMIMATVYPDIRTGRGIRITALFLNVIVFIVHLGNRTGSQPYYYSGDVVNAAAYSWQHTCFCKPNNKERTKFMIEYPENRRSEEVHGEPTLF